MKKIIAKKEKPKSSLLEYMHSISSIPKSEPTEITLIEWCDYWLSTRANNIKDSTRSSYINIINKHIKRGFEDMKISDITQDDVQMFINSLIIGYGLSEPLQPKTIKNIHGVLHKVLSIAVMQHCIPQNPADGIVLPPVERGERHPMNDTQLEKFFDRIANHEKKDIFCFTILTGLRESEVIGLTADCFDEVSKTLHVYRQLTYNKITHVYEFSSLKNNKSRVLTLTSQAYDIMVKYCSLAKDNEDFVFKNRANEHFTAAALYNSFKKVVVSIGLPKVTFHDLRHTHAVLALKAGVDIKTVQHNLGHYSAAFTLDVYGHCLDEMRVHGAEQLNDYMTKFEVDTNSNKNNNES